MDDKKKKKKATLWSKMETVKKDMGSQTAYKNYRISGGNSSFEMWKKENK